MGAFLRGGLLRSLVCIFFFVWISEYVVYICPGDLLPAASIWADERTPSFKASEDLLGVGCIQE